MLPTLTIYISQVYPDGRWVHDHYHDLGPVQPCCPCGSSATWASVVPPGHHCPIQPLISKQIISDLGASLLWWFIPPPTHFQALGPHLGSHQFPEGLHMPGPAPHLLS